MGTSYEVSKRQPSSGSDETEMSDSDDNERGVYEFSRSYLNNLRFLDEQYGIRRDGNSLKIGSAAVTADGNCYISIEGTRFKGTSGLWELLTLKNFIVT